MTASATRVLLVGDLHANLGAVLAVIDHASALGVDLILQVGDYGHWPRDRHGQKFARRVEARLALRGLDLWWVDGNHEDFVFLAQASQAAPAESATYPITKDKLICGLRLDGRGHVRGDQTLAMWERSKLKTSSDVCIVRAGGF